MIEVLRLASGKLLLSVGPHCVESGRDDAALNAACKTLAELSGEDRTRITVMVARATMSDA
jgi:hypothetical protein